MCFCIGEEIDLKRCLAILEISKGTEAYRLGKFLIGELPHAKLCTMYCTHYATEFAQ